MGRQITQDNQATHYYQEPEKVDVSLGLTPKTAQFLGNQSENNTFWYDGNWWCHGSRW